MNNDKVLCPRCQTEMKSNARYCMKCGYLNYNHPENIALKPYMGKLQESTNYVNGQAETRQFLGNRKMHEVRFGSKTGSKKLCFFINVISYLLLMALSFFLVYRNYDYLIDLLYSALPYLFLAVTVLFIYLYAIELIFMKMNERWWFAFVPILNIFKLSYRGMGSYWFGLLAFVPGVNIIYLFILAYKIGVKFGYNGFLFMLFWPVFIPMCGFGSNPYDGITYVTGLDNSSIEKEYKLTNTFIASTTTVLVLCLVLIGYLNRSIFADPIKALDKYYYVYASRAIVNNVKTDIKIRTINCDEGVYLLGEDGDYYFHYPSATNEAGLLFGTSRDEIESYVKVVHEGGVPTYYISLTDGKYGIEEKKVNEIGIKDVKEMTTLPQNYVGNNNCRVKTQ